MLNTGLSLSLLHLWRGMHWHAACVYYAEKGGDTMTETRCSVCDRPTTYDGQRQAVNLRGGRQAHIYCVQRKRGWSPDRIEQHTRQRIIAAGELQETR